jgi:hypothetical protein
MRRHQAINGGVGAAAVTLAMATTISIQLAALAGAVAIRPTTTAVPAVYVFGDSLLDVGNNNYLPGADVPRANMPYYGVDFPGGARPTGRFSNGYNVADLVGMYSLSPSRSTARWSCFWLTPDGHEWVQRRLWGSRGARRRTCRSRGAPADHIVSSPGASAE